jgi:hypothetical protein
MPEYRLYFMSRSNGHIDRLARFEAADDELAQERALERESEGPLELWCEGRKVLRIGSTQFA